MIIILFGYSSCSDSIHQTIFFSNVYPCRYFNCSSIADSRCSVPFSCCVPDPDTSVINYQCGYGVLALPPTEWFMTIYTIGCAQSLTDWFKTNVILLSCIGAALVLMQSIAICLARSLIGDVEEVKSYWWSSILDLFQFVGDTHGALFRCYYLYGGAQAPSTCLQASPFKKKEKKKRSMRKKNN